MGIQTKKWITLFVTGTLAFGSIGLSVSLSGSGEGARISDIVVGYN